MKIIILNNTQEVAQAAAKIFIKQINKDPQSTLGLATGSTPIETYQLLIKANQNHQVDFSKVKTFNLDEYIGLDKNNLQSYSYYMHHNFFDDINISQSNINIPCGKGDIDSNINDYNNLLDQNNIDIQLLGIGINGHIAFNEPGTDFNSITHKVKLSENTIKANSRFFDNDDDVPRYAITMGIKSIMKAKAIVLIAYGSNKAIAVKKLVEGSIDRQWPCSVLQSHKNATIILDKAAASLLSEKQR